MRHWRHYASHLKAIRPLSQWGFDKKLVDLCFAVWSKEQRGTVVKVLIRHFVWRVSENFRFLVILYWFGYFWWLKSHEKQQILNQICKVLFILSGLPIAWSIIGSGSILNTQVNGTLRNKKAIRAHRVNVYSLFCLFFAHYENYVLSKKLNQNFWL